MKRLKNYPFKQITSVFALFVCIIAFPDKDTVCCRTKILKLKDGQGKDEISKKLKSMHPRILVLTSSVQPIKGQTFTTPISPLPVPKGKSFNAK